MYPLYLEADTVMDTTWNQLRWTSWKVLLKTC